jgi:hypothetical protein
LVCAAQVVLRDDTVYFKQMRVLLEDCDHKDVCFVVGPLRQEVRAHKAVLVARCDYFSGIFRKGGMRESETNEVHMERVSVPTLERMLEYLYTNRVEQLKDCSAHEVRRTRPRVHPFRKSAPNRF